MTDWLHLHNNLGIHISDLLPQRFIMLMGSFLVSRLYCPMFLIKSYIVGYHVKTSYF